ncbi:hypothetical protein PMIN04_008594 [Paraphaeosphaeria minitans]
MSSVSFSQHIARRLHIPHHPTLAGPKLSTTALSMSSPAKTNGTKPQHMYLINPTVSLLNTKSPATRYVRSKPPAMPLDHFSIIVPLDSLEPLVSWLLAANSPFGFRELTRPVAHAVGLGESRPYLWVVGDSSTEATEAQVREWRKMHVAFTVESVEQVRAWHEAAVGAGGEDNGKPGPREEYHVGYHGAFVRDPVLGVNFEVVYREPWGVHR